MRAGSQVDGPANEQRESPASSYPNVVLQEEPHVDSAQSVVLPSEPAAVAREDPASADDVPSVPVEIITVHDPRAWLSTVGYLQGRHDPTQQSILQITAGRLLISSGRDRVLWTFEPVRGRMVKGSDRFAWNPINPDVLRDLPGKNGCIMAHCMCHSRQQNPISEKLPPRDQRQCRGISHRGHGTRCMRPQLTGQTQYVFLRAGLGV